MPDSETAGPSPTLRFGRDDKSKLRAVAHLEGEVDGKRTTATNEFRQRSISVQQVCAVAKALARECGWKELHNSK